MVLWRVLVWGVVVRENASFYFSGKICDDIKLTAMHFSKTFYKMNFSIGQMSSILANSAAFRNSCGKQD